MIPRLFQRLVDDAAVFPPGSAPLDVAVNAHREHRDAWYSEMVGPLLLPATQLSFVTPEIADGERLAIGVVCDVGVDALAGALEAADRRLDVRQIEAPVAKRGEDPQPGLRQLLAVLEKQAVPGYAEIPLTQGLFDALDTVADARAEGLPVAPKFRTGGLAAELFPSPLELAVVICGCRDRALPFKLTAGLHHAVRHTDPETGLVHHGFLNVLAATALAAEGVASGRVAEVLGGTEPAPLVEIAHGRVDQDRPLWIGYGSCSISEPLAGLARLGLLP